MTDTLDDAWLMGVVRSVDPNAVRIPPGIRAIANAILTASPAAPLALHDRVAIACIQATLTNATAYEAICMQCEASGAKEKPGEVLIGYAFEWADEYMRLRAKRANPV